MERADIDRIRWRSRRGLLELDLVFTRFLELHLSALDAEELEAYKDLLLYGDNDLLDLVNGRSECAEQRLAPVVQLLRNCRPGAPLPTHWEAA